ncbi:SMP-30/gluconolactonase/LRE family protein [Phenylobacterium montanum]|uniref:SMP-30/gluconolactonase/LRE family protein n=1 Tax=Phenylobacterium montanum TaxID=2823693 RepID=A0A975G559_9CAUL|nr:SMP-30/gluconolactonase/LRE family protein [Caulobacter sp. S6]QUD90236.1 SMP-30/gluconolactonase/LRE family protein [Caulobacter sp. S6]
MVPRRGSVLAAMAAGFALAAAILIPPPAKAGGSASVEPLTPAGAKLFPADAALQQVWRDQLGFFEGPAWDRRAGQFVFSDIPGNRLYRWNGRGAPQAWLSGIQTSHDGAILDPERNRYMVGPNGSVVTDDGGLIFCVFGGNRIERADLITGKRTTLAASSHRGPKFTRPNDIVLAPNGGVLFTADEGLFRLVAGHVKLVEGGIHPNGLAFSPDHKRFYMTEHPDRIMRYDVDPSGHLTGRTEFVRMTGDMSFGFVDGLKTDKSGRVFAVGPGGIWIFSVDGEHIATIHAPYKRFSNLAFGGADGRTLLLTAPEGVYTLREAPDL